MISSILHTWSVTPGVHRGIGTLFVRSNAR
jgi:hypothetical protein